MNVSLKDLIIVGLGSGLVYTYVQNKVLVEKTSAEKMQIFSVAVELAQDVILLKKSIEELKK